jgi:hypothetical protein
MAKQGDTLLIPSNTDAWRPQGGYGKEAGQAGRPVPNQAYVDPQTGRPTLMGRTKWDEKAYYGDVNNALQGGGGVAVDPEGREVNPNALPTWDPRNRKVSPAAAYLNMLRRSTDANAATNQALSHQMLGDLGATRDPRTVPGIELAGNVADDRQLQLGAAQALLSAGAGQAAQQSMLPGQVRANAAPSLGVQNQLLRSGGQVGAREAFMQQGLDRHLAGQAMGTSGPTAAGALFQQNLDRNIAAQRAMSMGVRGQGAAGAARQGTQAGVQLGLEAQAQAAQLRAQEQQAAQQLLAGNLATSRGQALDLYGTRAGVASQAGQDALGRDAAIAQILAQSRGQDLDQAGARVDALAGMRGQDLAAMQTTGQLGLDARQLDDQRRQAALMNALGLSELQLKGGALDNEMMLNAFNSLGGHLLHRRETDLAKQAGGSKFSKDFALAKDIGGTFTGAAASGMSMGMGG